MDQSDSDDEYKVKKKYIKYDVEASKLDSSGLYYKDSESEIEMESDSDTEKNKETLGENCLDTLLKEYEELEKIKM